MTSDTFSITRPLDQVPLRKNEQGKVWKWVTDKFEDSSNLNWDSEGKEFVYEESKNLVYVLIGYEFAVNRWWICFRLVQ